MLIFRCGFNRKRLCLSLKEKKKLRFRLPAVSNLNQLRQIRIRTHPLFYINTHSYIYIHIYTHIQYVLAYIGEFVFKNHR